MGTHTIRVSINNESPVLFSGTGTQPFEQASEYLYQQAEERVVAPSRIPAAEPVARESDAGGEEAEEPEGRIPEEVT